MKEHNVLQRAYDLFDDEIDIDNSWKDDICQEANFEAQFNAYRGVWLMPLPLYNVLRTLNRPSIATIY
jgi:hypothetical protein